MAAAGIAKNEKATGRRYDKGERRFKHVGKGAHPVIEFDDSEPKKWVGNGPQPYGRRRAIGTCPFEEAIRRSRGRNL
ncbi:hypothetical protein [Mesorhizobium escarrei]|uniref:hypothetical protein n=1 Tax=Mesorhizobium escarrei TaxID=666018 RepID=UPI0020A78F5B|nr:hypothetical protein [Mesorhizobium escarrei]